MALQHASKDFLTEVLEETQRSDSGKARFHHAEGNTASDRHARMGKRYSGQLQV